MPYRDFWTMYAPGQFYAAALSIALLGRELWAQAATLALVGGACAAGFFGLLSDRGLSRGAALGGAAVLTGMLWETAPEWSSYVPALLLLLAFWRRLARAGEEPIGFARLGLLLGAAAVFKHDVAAYAALGACVALAPGRSPRAWLGACARLAAGALAVAGPVIAWLALVSGRDAWIDLVVFPATEFRHVFGEPWPGLLPSTEPLRAWLDAPLSARAARDAAATLARWTSCRLPEVVFVLFALRCMRRDAGRAVLTWLAPMPLFWAAAHVQKNTHLTTLGLLVLVLLAVEWARARRPWIAVLAALQAGALLVVPALQIAEVAREASRSEPVALDGARGVRWARRDARSVGDAARFLRERLGPDEPFYSGLVRHDAVVIGNQRFYWLVGRPPGTRFNELHPGFADSESGQAAIEAELAAAGVRWVVLWDFGWSDEVLDGIVRRRREFRADLGATRLDRHFERDFEEVARFGEYRILRRR